MVCLVAQTEPSPSQSVGHDFWGFKEGAPDSVFGLAQASNGFLWLATNGLFRFDGKQFELFHSPVGDELLSTNVFSLLALPTGGLWIGYTCGGFNFLNNGRVTNYGGEIPSLTGTIRSLAQCGDGPSGPPRRVVYGDSTILAGNMSGR